MFWPHYIDSLIQYQYQKARMSARTSPRSSTSIGSFTLALHNRLKVETDLAGVQTKLEDQAQPPEGHQIDSNMATVDDRGIKIQPPNARNIKCKAEEMSNDFQDKWYYLRSHGKQRLGVVKRFLKRLQDSKEEQKMSIKIKQKEFFITKNNDCSIQPFYCGNCKKIFSQVNEFAIHCVEECRMPTHKSSSHFITSKPKEKAAPKRQDTIQNSTKNDPLSANQEHQTECNGEVALQQIQQLRQIVKKKIDHRSFPFYCGFCRKQFTEHAFYLDIFKNHHEKIEPSSSHIILKCKRSDIRLIYLSPYVQWPHNNPTYFCPCQSGKKMPMNQLIEHVMNAHNGVSPIYDLVLKNQKKNGPSRQIISTHESNPKLQAGPPLQQNETESHPVSSLKDVMSNIMENTLKTRTFPNRNITKDNDPIKEILINNLDHRSYPLICSICEIHFNLGYKYAHHFRIHHNNVIDRESSHVILQLIIFNSINNLYLAPKIKWKRDIEDYYCPCQPELKMGMPTLIQHVFEEHQGISPCYPMSKISYLRAFEDRMMREKHLEEVLLLTCNESMKKIINLHLIHKTIPFHCAECKKSFSYEDYVAHIVKIHKKIINRSSSHILIKVQDLRKFAHYLCLSPRDVPPDLDELNYCPCKPEKKMKLNSLVTHILKVHKGVSPTYFNLSQQTE